MPPCATCLPSTAIQRIVPWAASASFKPQRLSRRFLALVAAFDSGLTFLLSIVFGPNLDELGIRGKQQPLWITCVDNLGSSHLMMERFFHRFRKCGLPSMILAAAWGRGSAGVARLVVIFVVIFHHGP